MRPAKPEPNRTDPRPKITNTQEAETLVQSALAALDTLEPMIEEETRLFRNGKLRDALALALEKNEAAQHYTRCLEVMKTNAIALGRFQPEALELLRQRHEVFTRLMSLNMAVVATARTVSEGLMRELADTMGQNASPKTYIRGAIIRKPGTAPLSLSKMS